MKFTVTYRKQDGALATEVLDAADRAACVAACRTRGIVPTSVVQGGRTSAGLCCPSWAKGGIVGVIVLAIAGGVWWWLGRVETRPSATEKPAKVKEAKPESKPRAKPVRTNVGNVESTSSSNVLVRSEKAIVVDGDGTVPNSDTLTIAPTNSSPLSSPSPFKSGTEQVMGWIFMCPVGKMPPMLPTIPSEELARIDEILNSPNLVNSDDSERIADMKETVELAKQELKAFLAQGGKVEDFLAHYHGLLVKAHRARESARMAAESVDRNDPGLSDEFRKKVNEMLDKEGIEALDDK